MNYQQLEDHLLDLFGEPGAFALRTSDITQEDMDKGLEHCIEKLGEAIYDEQSKFQGDG